MLTCSITHFSMGQDENASSCIDPMIGANPIDTSREHLPYLQPVITQYFVRNKSEICHRPLRVHSKG